MLTRLARLETQKNFSVSSIEFLAVEKCDKQREQRSFNDGRYAKPPAGCLARELGVGNLSRFTGQL